MVPEDNEYFDETQADWVFVDCFKKAETKLAFIPGIESHWFWSTIWIIGHYPISLASYDKYFCFRGLIIFNDCL